MDSLTPLIEKLKENEKRISENHIIYLKKLKDLLKKYKPVVSSFQKSTTDSIVLIGGKERDDLKITIKEYYGEFKWFYRIRFSSNGNFIVEQITPYSDDKIEKREYQIDDLDNEIADLKLIKSFLEIYLNSKAPSDTGFPFIG